MAEKSWVKGRGVDGVEDEVTPATLRRVTEAEKKKARTRVRVPAAAGKTSAVASDDDALVDRMLTALAKEIKESDGDFTLSVTELSEKIAISKSFLRFSLANEVKIINPLKELIGGSPSISFDGTKLTVVMDMPDFGDEDPEPATKKSVKKVKVAAADPDFFHIDPTRLKVMKAVVDAGLNYWAVGPTGTGKSETEERFLEKIKRAFVKMSFNGESSADDLLGHFELRGTETVWCDGALPIAMKEGKVLICEEIDAAPAECNLALQRALEHRKGTTRRFYNPRNGEEIEGKEGFLIMATANTAGGGDYSGLYAGTQTQNAAFRDRFVFDYYDYLPSGVEVQVLNKRFPKLPSDIIKKVVQFAKAARNAVATGVIFTPVSTRTLCAFAELHCALRDVGMGTEKALVESLDKTIFHKSASETDSKALKEMSQRVFGNLK